MLSLEIRPVEYFDENSEEFYFAFPWAPKVRVESNKSFVLQLEHSLLSLSRWEEKWKIPFLVDEPKKTTEQLIDYIRFMTLTKNVPRELYNFLSNEEMAEIISYIDDPHTATWFSEGDKKDQKNGKKPQIITAEIIYYWMTTQNIPWDPTERWHLNRLLTLIRVFSIKNTPKETKSQKELSRDFAKAKAARRAAKAKRK